jgi:hypothetical protein
MRRAGRPWKLAIGTLLVVGARFAWPGGGGPAGALSPASDGLPRLEPSLGGPTRAVRGSVGGGEVDAWTFLLREGRPTVVRVSPAGLACVVADAAGERVDSTGGSPRGCSILLVPPRTGVYGVRVRNPAGPARDYVLVIEQPAPS